MLFNLTVTVDWAEASVLDPNLILYPQPASGVRLQAIGFLIDIELYRWGNNRGSGIVSLGV